MKKLLPVLLLTLISGCSVVGKSDVNHAPYTVVKASKDNDIELREYNQMILVSTFMATDKDGEAFKRLFDYISGANKASSEIAMTAPVFMNRQENKNENKAQQGQNIAMTAPVFMNSSPGESVMSFVMPQNFTRQSTPEPTSPDIWVSEVSNLSVAAITFSGTLSEDNKQQHTKRLKDWVAEQNLQIQGEAMTAAYNGPFTLPMFRRNEVLIEVK